MECVKKMDKKSVTNENFTRCSECGYIYESSAKSCPNCGTLNSNARVFEQVSINESAEPVFNIID